jgi:hypothetical protein
VDRCYKLHGFPPGYQPRSRSFQSHNSSMSSRFLHNKRNDESRGATAVAVTSNTGSLTSDQIQQLISYLSNQMHTQHHESVEPPPASTFTPESLVSQMYGKNPQFYSISTFNMSSSSWILDSRATHHVCCCEDHFSNAASVQD